MKKQAKTDKHAEKGQQHGKAVATDSHKAQKVEVITDQLTIIHLMENTQ